MAAGAEGLGGLDEGLDDAAFLAHVLDEEENMEDVGPNVPRLSPNGASGSHVRKQKISLELFNKFVVEEPDAKLAPFEQCDAKRL